MNIKYNEQQILELYSEGKTDKEIADFFGVTETAFACKRRRLGIPTHKNYMRENYIPTKSELAIIIGTLLGDATIRLVHNKCKYPNLTFVHSPKQEEYFNCKTNKLKLFCSSAKKYEDKNKLNKYGYKLVYTGMNMKCLEEIRNIFYPNNKKILPIQYLKEYFTEESLYYMFMDDGSYDICTNSYIINTQCFTKENLLDFIKLLKEKFDLSFSIKADNCLYLKHESNKNLKNILIKYNECNSMQYKCGDEGHR